MMSALLRLSGWDLVLAAISVILIVFILPAIIYFASGYTLHLDHIVFSKRYSKIVFWEIVIFVIKVIFSIATFISLILTHQRADSLPVQISLLLSNSAAYTLYLTWVWRFYLLMYQANWIMAAKNDHWQHIINPSYKDLVADWFITNKKKYANLTWTFLHLFLPLLIVGWTLQNLWILADWMGIIASKLTYDILKCMDYVIGCIPFILLLMVYFRIPLFRDKFFIHEELRRILFALCIQYLAFLGTVVIRIVSPHSIYWTATYFVSILCEFAAMSVATKWVLRQCLDIINSESYHLRKFESKSKNEYVSIDSPRNTFHEQMQRLSSQHQGVELTLEQVLSASDTSFTLFMIQLSNEFSQELLLCFIEMIQFQQLIAKYISLNDLEQPTDSSDIQLALHQSVHAAVNKQRYEMITFPMSVPLSYIIYGEYHSGTQFLVDEMDFACAQDEFIEKLKVFAWNIFDKYIETGAQFQANVGHGAIRAFQKQMRSERFWKSNTENAKIHKLLHIFDGCIFEVYSLMMDSYARFRKTQRYFTLQQIAEV